MKKWLSDVVGGQSENHILPFLWMLGEEWEKTRRQLYCIHECGIRAVCLESRTFEDFCGDSWWETLEKIFAEARKLDMKVWILDDKHFPTGYAVGKVDEKYPDKRRLHLAMRYTDVIGPRNADFLIRGYSDEDICFGAVAVKRNERDESLSEECVSLDVDESGHIVSFDSPQGCWRVFSLWITHQGSTTETGYINMLDESAVDALIEEVYEAHYRHIGQYFGKEFAGFFSDEPNLGNANLFGKGSRTSDGTAVHSLPGEPGLAMPWCYDMYERLNEKMGCDVKNILPQLWFDGPEAVDLREAYMDTVSELYGQRFTYRLGNWCRSHGVEYIGHVIEDMNSHARLGCSDGHFFRSLEGQDMAGMDIVLHQVMPGFANHDSAASAVGNVVSSAFNHYMLGKMAASLAHIRPHMKNRTMCEVFGAYGWAEDMPTMKWLIDHLLVRGVNWFVPHAFSPVYPNPDCPPHFDADGENPQLDDFACLMRYTNQMSTILSGNRKVRIAVLYHAEAEWSGKEFMLDENVNMELLDHQMDFDIVPCDDLKAPVFENGRWVVGNASYEALIVPQAEYLPQYAIDSMNKLANQGLRLIEVDKQTKGLDAEIVALSDLANYMTEHGFADVFVKNDDCPLLRFMNLVRDDGTQVFMFFNEATDRRAEAEVQLPVSGGYTLIDLLGNRIENHIAENGCINLSLAPFESVVVVFDDSKVESLTQTLAQPEKLDALWKIEASDAENLTEYQLLEEKTALKTIEKMRPLFAGRVRYTARLYNLQDVQAIELEHVGDTAMVFVNGQEIGRRICPPYYFDIADKVHEGENEVQIVVSTTLARKIRDPFSEYMAMNRPGLSGQVIVYRK